MKIIVDIGGADKGYITAISAAINIVDKIDEKVVLVGKKEDILNAFNKLNKSTILNKFEIIECSEYISNNDDPANAIKNKKESNLVKAFDYMKKEEDIAFISASSTGALVAGSLLKIGRISKIHRPALMSLLPSNKNKPVIFLDTGANIEAKEVSLIQYAMLGEIYCKYVLGNDNPKIGLLNIGAEEKKGTTILKKVHKILKQSNENFVGNIEPREILNGDIDIIVCDGVMGNIAIKSLEGAVHILKNELKKEFKKNIFNKIKSAFVKNMFKDVIRKFDYKKLGGAVLIGVKKPIIKVHGSSDVITYEKAIYQASLMLKQKVIEKVKEEIEREDKI